MIIENKLIHTCCFFLFFENITTEERASSPDECKKHDLELVRKIEKFVLPHRTLYFGTRVYPRNLTEATKRCGWFQETGEESKQGIMVNDGLYLLGYRKPIEQIYVRHVTIHSKSGVAFCHKCVHDCQWSIFIKLT